MIQISEPNPTLDALAKLHTLYTTQGVEFKEADSTILCTMSDSIYSRDKPQDYEFTEHEKDTIERLWNEYAGL